VEDLLGILVFILFVGASLIGRMKKAQGPRPPFNPSAGPPLVEEEEELDPYEDPWGIPAKPKPAPAPAPAPALATGHAQPPMSALRRPRRERQAMDSTESRFAEFRSNFQVDDPIEMEDLGDDAPSVRVLGNAHDLAQAVVMSEVLGKPRALRKLRH